MTVIRSPLSEGTLVSAEELLSEHCQPRRLQLKRRAHLPSEISGFWKIHSGYIRTLTWSLDGECVSLGFWRPGEVIGAAIVQVHPYEAQCLSDVTVEYLGSHYRFSKEMVLAQVAQSNSLLRIVHCSQVEQRLLLFLIWLAQRLGKATPQGYLIEPKLTHKDIAESIGSTRVTVTRLIKVLERAGRISWHSRERVIYHNATNDCCEYL